MNYKKSIPYYIYVFVLMAFISCNSHPELPETFLQKDSHPIIYPDYKDVTIPNNIAPLNFMVENVDECIAYIKWNGGSATYGNGNKIQIPIKEWKKMMDEAKGNSLIIDLYTLQQEKWFKHPSFFIHVAQEEIDPYISYRVIYPSYIAYEMLSINQRHLTDFDETVIYNNMMVKLFQEHK